MNNDTLRIGAIGCGYWGPNLVRNFSSLKNCEVKYVVDASPERREFVESSLPSTTAVEDHHKVLEDPDVDAIIIATPARLHFSQAEEALRAADTATLEPIVNNDADAFFAGVAADKNARQICGVAPIYVALRLGESTGELLRYGQGRIHPESGSVVSYAALAFA